LELRATITNVRTQAIDVKKGKTGGVQVLWTSELDGSGQLHARAAISPDVGVPAWPDHRRITGSQVILDTLVVGENHNASTENKSQFYNQHATPQSWPRGAGEMLHYAVCRKHQSLHLHLWGTT
jgi:hypothetical protein